MLILNNRKIQRLYELADKSARLYNLYTQVMANRCKAPERAYMFHGNIEVLCMLLDAKCSVNYQYGYIKSYRLIDDKGRVIHGQEYEIGTIIDNMRGQK